MLAARFRLACARCGLNRADPARQPLDCGQFRVPEPQDGPAQLALL